MRVRAIVNPRAGVKAARAFRAVETAHGAWDSIEMKVTEAPGHAQALAREAAERGDSLVVTVGGDGTANEAASGLLGSDTALAIVPAGSGNGLARTLGIPLDFGRALAALQNGVRRRMDVGYANERLFLNVAGAGFDADVAHAFHLHSTRGGRRGVFSYLRLCLRMVGSYAPNAWKVTTESASFEGRAYIVAVANGRQYGGGARMSPRARLDDGRVDVVVLEAAPLHRLLLGAWRAFFGDLDRFRPYRRFEAQEAVVVPGRPAFFHRDGEPDAEVERLAIRLVPRALPVIVPGDTAEDPQGPFTVGPE